tara:strand:+ start:463 stop:2406 length:1944 start_codon:yes stop_codon:yes gene_type:complete
MASQVSPGVVIKERDLSNAVIVGDSQITAAIASTFAKGPINEVTSIANERELIDVFGTPSGTGTATEDWLVASEFLAYGGRLAVVRVAGSGAANANTGGNSNLIDNESDFEAGATGSDAEFVARSAGAAGNNLRVVVVDRGADQIVQVAGHSLTAGDAYTDPAGAAHTVVQDLGTDFFSVTNDTATAVAVGGSGAAEVLSVQPWYNNTSIAATGLKLSAIGPRPGTTAFATEAHLKKDEVHVAVIDESTNTVVERFTFLSKLSDAKSPEGASLFYRDVINAQSKFIYAGATRTGGLTTAGNAWGNTAASYAATAAAPETMKLTAGAADSLTYDGDLLANGADGSAYTTSEVTAGYNLFLDTEQVDIDFVLMGGSMSSEANTKTKAQAVIGVATSRMDCVAFVSPDKSNQIGTSGALTPTAQKDNTIAYFDTMPSTSYAVYDSGLKYTYDRFNDRYLYLPCNGDVAGLCVRTSAIIDDWISPAGLNRGGLRNAVKLAFNPGKAARDELYQARINPIVTLPGAGTLLFGDKTGLASPSAFDRINVRRLFLNIEARVRRLAEGVLFEQNDVTTRSGFAGTVNSYLSEIQARRGLTDYLVVCDESNNTPDVVDRNEFVAELYLKPTRSINYVTVTLTATRTGVAFSEVIGR